MALFIGGMTCPLCGKELRPSMGQQVISFRAFVPNRLDPLYSFSDATVHEECFRAHPLGNPAEKHVAELAFAKRTWRGPALPYILRDLRAAVDGGNRADV